MAAAIALTLLIALVSGRLSQFLRLGLQQLVESLLYAATHKILELSLDYFLVKLYNLFRHGLLAPFRMVCRDFILPEFCKPCLFLFLRNLLYLICFFDYLFKFILQLTNFSSCRIIIHMLHIKRKPSFVL